MSKIDISIITPTKNHADYLEECINSVQASILNPLELSFEHIIVNDGSTDQTDQILKKHKEIVRIDLPSNSGAAFARNSAIQIAQGNLLFFLDDDDILLQRTLYNLYLQSINNPDYLMIIADFLRINQNRDYIIGNDYYGWQFDNNSGILRAIFEGKHFIQHSFIIHKSIVQTVGGYDPNLKHAQDLDLYVNLLIHGIKPKYVPIISHLHRFHSSNLSSGYTPKDHISDLKILYIKYQKYLNEFGINLKVD